MEHRGRVLTPLTTLDDLRRVVSGGDPFLSLYLAMRPAAEDAAEAARLEWRAARAEAVEQGAPAPMLDAVGDTVASAGRRAPGVGVVVPSGRRPHVEQLGEPPASRLVRWGPVPALAPLVAARQRHLPHVVALVDRVGAEISVRAAGDPARARTTEVEGDDFPLTKVAPGGWSQRRFQQRAEDTWHRNMVEVAAELAAVAERSDARLVAVGGDERAVSLLRDQLPAAVERLVRPVSTTRAVDGSAHRLEAEVAGLVERSAHDALRETIDLYREELGQDDRACTGARDTLGALAASRVALLLLSEEVARPAAPGPDAPRAWVGSRADMVAASRNDLAAPGEGHAAPLVDAAVAAALASGADIAVVPGDGAEHELADGLGALLRW